MWVLKFRKIGGPDKKNQKQPHGRRLFIKYFPYKMEGENFLFDGWDGWDGDQKYPLNLFILRYIKHYSYTNLYIY